mmetsp:Transcript_5355/g.21910  ORF Transcript_5355/g.21910 Transcript_5355/m.21910 type:complete len:223 (+) Transcript_5355:1347-2015(+)
MTATRWSIGSTRPRAGTRRRSSSSPTFTTPPSRSRRGATSARVCSAPRPASAAPASHRPRVTRTATRRRLNSPGRAPISTPCSRSSRRIPPSRPSQPRRRSPNRRRRRARRRRRSSRACERRFRSCGETPCSSSRRCAPGSGRSGGLCSTSPSKSLKGRGAQRRTSSRRSRFTAACAPRRKRDASMRVGVRSPRERERRVNRRFVSARARIHRLKFWYEGKK